MSAGGQISDGCPMSRAFRDMGLARYPSPVLRVTAARCLLIYSKSMPWGLERWHGGHDLHFITFSCYHRQRLLGSVRRRDLFLQVLEQVRQRYGWVVLGYVVMPEHVHLLVSEPLQRKLSTAIQALKLGFTRRVLVEQRRRRSTQLPLFDFRPTRMWQARYHDFNVCTGKKRVAKLRYLHRNPVRRGFVQAPGVVALEQFPQLRIPRGGHGPNQ